MFSISNEQPLAANTMDLYRDFHLPFKNDSSLIPPPPYSKSYAKLHHDQLDDCSSPHQCPDAQRCHASRLRRVILPAVIALVSLGGLLALSCVLDAFIGIEDAGGLLRRATDGNENTFVNNKLYLIIVFVGLFLVVILAICLSAWCCRGSFQNPLCCPCYWCACCGGLACLECIGCGLCAEGIENA
ncbi:hypothetical protein J3R30DRAFT_2715377 [Lentinula aciculospora]|uniref:Uncharacterized protein n=1 Tax=Lentinula aciculospora TaxID=153920 RepID=A0A9W9DNI6_9AGAR|nr:hypothetical protein J3R30DRAFT_2715377 [Lentinula aciculospora]